MVDAASQPAAVAFIRNSSKLGAGHSPKQGSLALRPSTVFASSPRSGPRAPSRTQRHADSSASSLGGRSESGSRVTHGHTLITLTTALGLKYLSSEPKCASPSASSSAEGRTVTFCLGLKQLLSWEAAVRQKPPRPWPTPRCCRKLIEASWTGQRRHSRTMIFHKGHFLTHASPHHPPCPCHEVRHESRATRATLAFHFCRSSLQGSLP